LVSTLNLNIKSQSQESILAWLFGDGENKDLKCCRRDTEMVFL